MMTHKMLGALLAILCLLLAPVKTQGEKLYEYRDEDGVLHFTNIAPDTVQPVKVEQVRVSGVDDRVYVSNVGTNEEPIVSVTNGYGGPVEIEFLFVERENVSSDPELPARMVVVADARTAVLRIWPTKRNQIFSYGYSYRYCFGDPAAQHRPTRPYRPPFRTGEVFHISQAFHGPHTHKDPQSEYAIDIAMPVGTPVCAAREGVVMDIAHDFFRGGTDREEYLRRANFIRILHEDGTMGLYAHLALETIRARIGTRVSAGEIIAESGNTGFSSGPHLHFAVLKNTGMELVSLPFKIENTAGDGVTPVQDMMLLAR